MPNQEGGTHYEKCAIEPLEIIDSCGLDFREGNVIKYILRYKKKGKPGSESRIKDLKKARHYVEMLISIEENHTGPIPLVSLPKEAVDEFKEITAKALFPDSVEESAEKATKEMEAPKALQEVKQELGLVAKMEDPEGKVTKDIEIPKAIKMAQEQVPPFMSKEFKEYVAKAVEDNNTDVRLTIPFVREMIELEMKKWPWKTNEKK